MVSAEKQLLNLFCAILVVKIGDFLLLTYVNKYVNKLEDRTILDCFCNGIQFTQSHRPKDVIPDFYDKCERGLNKIYGREP